MTTTINKRLHPLIKKKERNERTGTQREGRELLALVMQEAGRVPRIPLSRPRHLVPPPPSGGEQGTRQTKHERLKRVAEFCSGYVGNGGKSRSSGSSTNTFREWSRCVALGLEKKMIEGDTPRFLVKKQHNTCGEERYTRGSPISEGNRQKKTAVLNFVHHGAGWIQKAQHISANGSNALTISGPGGGSCDEYSRD